MQWVDFLRWAHVLGATVLFGTGLGTAFFMYRAHRTGIPSLIAHVAGTVVIADGVFTATAVVFPPITGFALALHVGWPLTEGWILLSLLLYALAGIFWLPVLWIQLKVRDITRSAARAGDPLPERYQRLFRLWFACGWPAFIAVLLILWLMVNKPSFAIL
jgi:uncharacterized membrane protein